MNTQDFKKVEALGWTLTDDDCFQWCREVPSSSSPLGKAFELCQIVQYPGGPFCACVWHGIVDVGAKTESELEKVVSLYGYLSLAEFVEDTSPYKVDFSDSVSARENNPDWVLEYGLLAEMFFETTPSFDLGMLFQDEKTAEDYIFQNILSKPLKW